MKLFRIIRYLIWLPFWVASNMPFVIAFNLVVGYLNHSAFAISCIISAIIAGVAHPIAQRLRPPPRAFAPPVGKPLVAGLVRLGRKISAPSPGRSKLSRSLSPQLKGLLRQPADQKPAAVLFEERKVAQLKAERADAA